MPSSGGGAMLLTGGYTGGIVMNRIGTVGVLLLLFVGLLRTGT